MRIRGFFVLLLALIIPIGAGAQDVTPPFVGIPLNWYTDRYTPSSFGLVDGFQGRNNVLEIGVSSSTDLVNRTPGYQTTFYNTTGMKTDINVAGSWMMQADLWIDPRWIDPQTGIIRSDMWATATDNPGFTNPSAYPIIGVTNYNGPLRARGYNVNTGAWIDGGTLNLGAWNTLAMGFDFASNTFSYYVNGSLLASILGTDPSTGIANGMFQAYNFNDPSLPNIPMNLGNPTNPDYAVHWSNTPEVSAIPEPSTYALMAVGLAALAFVSKRRNRKQNTFA